MSGFVRPVRLLAFCALGTLAAACRPAPQPPPLFSFVGVFDRATIQRETRDVVFGTPAARALLRAGWSADETTPEGRPFVWSDGEESSLEFFLTRARPLPLRLRCEPLAGPGLPAQRLTLELNTYPLVTLPLEPGPHGYQALLPAERLVAGTNRLTFRYGTTRRPADLQAGSSDRRLLGVAWHELTLGSSRDQPAAPPDVVPAQETLRLPAGSEASFHLRLPSLGLLTADGVELSGTGSALRVLVQPDGETERELARVESTRGAWAASLAADGGKVARVSFRALGGAEGTTGSVRLVRPLLRGEARREPPAAAAAPARRRPSVFVYLVDTLRADHLGCYGYGRPTSPSLDAFAREATRYRGVAPSSWTKASVASLLTGLLPLKHRAQDRGDTLPAGTTTLAQLLGAAGYRTYALYANSWVSETFGLDRGFEERRFVFGRSDRLNREAFGRLAALKQDESLFAYVHTIDPHAPYEPTPEFRARFAPRGGTLRRASIEWLEGLATHGRLGRPATPREVEEITALYDAEIAFNDLQFGRFVEELKRLGLYDDALVVFTSDHGEELFDHGGVSHGHHLFGEVIDVPLLVKWPRGTVPPAGAEGSRAQLLDVVPTVLDLAGLALPANLDGRSLLRPRPVDPGGNGYLSFLDLDGLKSQSASEERWKLIQQGDIDAPRPAGALYDLERGSERRDETGAHPVVSAYLAAQLRAAAARRPRSAPPPQAVLPPEVTERLRALGYIR